MSTILTYHVKHHQDYSEALGKAFRVAEFAVVNKKDKKLISSSASVKSIGLASAISNQILRKYGKNKKIKKVKRVNLVLPGQSIQYNHETQKLRIVPLKHEFTWSCGRPFSKINQIEVSPTHYMICVSFHDEKMRQIPSQSSKLISVDMNCGYNSYIMNCFDHQNKKVFNWGKTAPHIRYKYQKLRQKCQSNGAKKKLKEIGDREKRIIKNIDHQLSRKLVNYAAQNKLRIVLEDLKNIRKKRRRTVGKKNRTVNRIVNSWSFYRLRTYIEYKAKLHGVPVEAVPPHYTSQLCSFCHTQGNRDKRHFVCLSKKCSHFGKARDSDVNAAFNIGRRYLEVSKNRVSNVTGLGGK